MLNENGSKLLRLSSDLQQYPIKKNQNLLPIDIPPLNVASGL